MVQKSFLFVSFTFFFSLSVCSQQKLSITPARPQPGDTITIQYNPKAAEATIGDTATQVDIVFTYSNFYELPNKIPMQIKEGNWQVSFVLPRYAVYATFYLQSGAQKDQPSPDRHFEIAAYNSRGARVENGYLYEGYSLSAQKGRVPGLAAMQAALFKKELVHYPDNYEAQLRLLTYKMSTAKTQSERTDLRKKAEGIIAAKFRQAPGNMGVLNRVTMGYLIIGENSRLDSIRAAVKQQYPQSEAGYELRIADLREGTDTLETIAALQKLLKEEKASNSKYLSDAHLALMELYAAKGMEAEALSHLDKATADNSPYRAQTLKHQAEVLMQNGIGLDKALKLAAEAITIADTYPAGLIRYFPETGYLPAYVAPEKRARVTATATANLLSLMSLIEWKRGNETKAVTLMHQALQTSTDVETLSNAAVLYKRTARYQQAYEAYRNIMLQTPEDTMALAGMKETYVKWKGSNEGWPYELAALEAHWKKEMTAALQKQMIREKAPVFLENIVDLEGRPLAGNLLQNKIVVIDFWATWCVPCMQEMPYVHNAYKKYEKANDVVFMIINSAAKNSLQDAQGWWGNKKYDFPVYYNTDARIGDKFGFNVIPATYIIDKKGDIRLKTIGFEGPSIQRKIEAAIELLRAEEQGS
jgi:thiol-disulfide isomerase/thioredoxin